MSFLINPYAFLAAGGDFEPIATVTVGSGGVDYVDFTSISSAYQHLQLRVVARESNRSDTNSDLAIQFNSDTTSGNYVIHTLSGNGASAAAAAITSRGNVGAYRGLTAANATASIFGAAIVDILDYTSTTKNKTVRSLGGQDQNGSGVIAVTSGLWLSTSAITSMRVFSHYSPGKLAEHSTLALYGVSA